MKPSKKTRYIKPKSRMLTKTAVALLFFVIVGGIFWFVYSTATPHDLCGDIPVSDYTRASLYFDDEGMVLTRNGQQSRWNGKPSIIPSNTWSALYGNLAYSQRTFPTLTAGMFRGTITSTNGPVLQDALFFLSRSYIETMNCQVFGS